MPKRTRTCDGSIKRFRVGRRLVFYPTGHRARAHRLLEQLQEHHAEVQSWLARVRAGQDQQERQRRHREGQPRGDSFAMHDAVVITSALAVEGFLNTYGVIRFGEPFFKNFVERLGTEQKTAILIAICTGNLVSRDADILRAIRALFERRGALVHPKAREPREERAISAALASNVYEVKDAASAVAEMESFFAGMVALDQDVAVFLADEQAWEELE
jgi:hypothetical protein